MSFEDDMWPGLWIGLIFITLFKGIAEPQGLVSFLMLSASCIGFYISIGCPEEFI